MSGSGVWLGGPIPGGLTPPGYVRSPPDGGSETFRDRLRASDLTGSCRASSACRLAGRLALPGEFQAVSSWRWTPVGYNASLSPASSSMRASRSRSLRAGGKHMGITSIDLGRPAPGGDGGRRAGSVGVEPSPDGRGQAPCPGDRRGTGRVRGAPGRHDGRPELPVATGRLAGKGPCSRRGSRTVRCGWRTWAGRTWSTRGSRTAATTSATSTGSCRRRRPRHERCGESLGPVVPGNPIHVTTRPATTTSWATR